MNEWVVWLFEGIIVGAALMILFSKSVFHAALNLLTVVLCIGVIFGLYGSEFLFISQIMVYGGGILVLILFATMVTAKKSFERAQVDSSFSIPISLAALGVVVVIASYIVGHEAFYNAYKIPYVVSTPDLGRDLVGKYSLPLEVAAVLLLVSLIAAVLSSIQKPSES